MYDTNILISMILFPSDQFRKLQDVVSCEHTLVLSTIILEELEAVISRKFPLKKDAVECFLGKINFELVYTPHRMPKGMFEIRDLNDYPVLYTAVVENIDIFLTGDKDFQNLDIDKPQIMTISEFLTQYT